MESKKLGFWSIVLLGINGIIGSGIFLLPNKAMAIIGPASLLVMIFDMLFVLLKPADYLRKTAVLIFMPKRLLAISSGMR